YSSAASSSYNGLQTQVQKRLSRNVQGQISYTFSKTTDNGVGLIGSLGDSRSGGRSGYVNPFNLNADRSISSLDVPHLLSADAIIDLPFGNERRNAYRSPAIWNTDVSLFKNTTLTERLRMQIGIEFFNFWNHAKRTVPINDITNGGFGRFDSFFPGRVIQYRAKLIF